MSFRLFGHLAFPGLSWEEGRVRRKGLMFRALQVLTTSGCHRPPGDEPIFVATSFLLLQHRLASQKALVQVT